MATASLPASSTTQSNSTGAETKITSVVFLYCIAAIFRHAPNRECVLTFLRAWLEQNHRSRMLFKVLSETFRQGTEGAADSPSTVGDLMQLLEGKTQAAISRMLIAAASQLPAKAAGTAEDLGRLSRIVTRTAHASDMFPFALRLSLADPDLAQMLWVGVQSLPWGRDLTYTGDKRHLAPFLANLLASADSARIRAVYTAAIAHLPAEEE